jgi:hypothetical protein
LTMREIPMSPVSAPVAAPFDDGSAQPVIPKAAIIAMEQAATRLFATGRDAVRFNIEFPLSGRFQIDNDVKVHV